MLSSDLAARNKPRYSLWTANLVLLVTIVLNLVLIPLMGIQGAALTSTITYIFACYMSVVFYRRESGTSLAQLMPGRADLRFVSKTSWQMMVNAWQRRPWNTIPPVPPVGQGGV